MATVTELQDFLFTTLKGIQDGTVDVDKAKAITEVANTMVNSAKVEVDFARVVGNVDSKFLQRQEYTPPKIPEKQVETTPALAEIPIKTKSVTANGGKIERDGPVTTHRM